MMLAKLVIFSAISIIHFKYSSSSTIHKQPSHSHGNHRTRDPTVLNAFAERSSNKSTTRTIIVPVGLVYLVWLDPKSVLHHHEQHPSHKKQKIQPRPPSRASLRLEKKIHKETADQSGSTINNVTYSKKTIKSHKRNSTSRTSTRSESKIQSERIVEEKVSSSGEDQILEENKREQLHRKNLDLINQNLKTLNKSQIGVLQEQAAKSRKKPKTAASAVDHSSQALKQSNIMTNLHRISVENSKKNRNKETHKQKSRKNPSLQTIVTQEEELEERKASRKTHKVIASSFEANLEKDFEETDQAHESRKKHAQNMRDKNMKTVKASNVQPRTHVQEDPAWIETKASKNLEKLNKQEEMGNKTESRKIFENRVQADKEEAVQEEMLEKTKESTKSRKVFESSADVNQDRVLVESNTAEESRKKLKLAENFGNLNMHTVNKSNQKPSSPIEKLSEKETTEKASESGTEFEVIDQTVAKEDESLEIGRKNIKKLTASELTAVNGEPEYRRILSDPPDGSPRRVFIQLFSNATLQEFIKDFQKKKRFNTKLDAPNRFIVNTTNLSYRKLKKFVETHGGSVKSLGKAETKKRTSSQNLRLVEVEFGSKTTSDLSENPSDKLATDSDLLELTTVEGEIMRLEELNTEARERRSKDDIKIELSESESGSEEIDKATQDSRRIQNVNPSFKNSEILLENTPDLKDIPTYRRIFLDPPEGFPKHFLLKIPYKSIQEYIEADRRRSLSGRTHKSKDAESNFLSTIFLPARYIDKMVTLSFHKLKNLVKNTFGGSVTPLNTTAPNRNNVSHNEDLVQIEVELGTASEPTPNKNVTDTVFKNVSTEFNNTDETALKFENEELIIEEVTTQNIVLNGEPVIQEATTQDAVLNGETVIQEATTQDTVFEETHASRRQATSNLEESESLTNNALREDTRILIPEYRRIPLDPPENFPKHFLLQIPNESIQNFSETNQRRKLLGGDNSTLISEGAESVESSFLSVILSPFYSIIDLAKLSYQKLTALVGGSFGGSITPLNETEKSIQITSNKTMKQIEVKLGTDPTTKIPEISKTEEVTESINTPEIIEVTTESLTTVQETSTTSTMKPEELNKEASIEIRARRTEADDLDDHNPINDTSSEIQERSLIGTILDSAKASKNVLRQGTVGLLNKYFKPVLDSIMSEVTKESMNFTTNATVGVTIPTNNLQNENQTINSTTEKNSSFTSLSPRNNSSPGYGGDKETLTPNTIQSNLSNTTKDSLASSLPPKNNSNPAYGEDNATTLTSDTTQSNIVTTVKGPSSSSLSPTSEGNNGATLTPATTQSNPTTTVKDSSSSSLSPGNNSNPGYGGDIETTLTPDRTQSNHTTTAKDSSSASLPLDESSNPENVSTQETILPFVSTENSIKPENSSLEVETTKLNPDAKETHSPDSGRRDPVIESLSVSESNVEETSINDESARKSSSNNSLEVEDRSFLDPLFDGIRKASKGVGKIVTESTRLVSKLLKPIFGFKDDAITERNKLNSTTNETETTNEPKMENKNADNTSDTSSTSLTPENVSTSGKEGDEQITLTPETTEPNPATTTMIGSSDIEIPANVTEIEETGNDISERKELSPLPLLDEDTTASSSNNSLEVQDRFFLGPLFDGISKASEVVGNIATGSTRLVSKLLKPIFGYQGDEMTERNKLNITTNETETNNDPHTKNKKADKTTGTDVSFTSFPPEDVTIPGKEDDEQTTLTSETTESNDDTATVISSSDSGRRDPALNPFHNHSSHMPANVPKIDGNKSQQSMIVNETRQDETRRSYDGGKKDFSTSNSSVVEDTTESGSNRSLEKQGAWSIVDSVLEKAGNADEAVLDKYFRKGAEIGGSKLAQSSQNGSSEEDSPVTDTIESNPGTTTITESPDSGRRDPALTSLHYNVVDMSINDTKVEELSSNGSSVRKSLDIPFDNLVAENTTELLLNRTTVETQGSRSIMESDVGKIESPVNNTQSNADERSLKNISIINSDRQESKDGEPNGRKKSSIIGTNNTQSIQDAGGNNDSVDLYSIVTTDTTQQSRKVAGASDLKGTFPSSTTVDLLVNKHELFTSSIIPPELQAPQVDDAIGLKSTLDPMINDPRIFPSTTINPKLLRKEPLDEPVISTTIRIELQPPQVADASEPFISTTIPPELLAPSVDNGLKGTLDPMVNEPFIIGRRDLTLFEENETNDSTTKLHESRSFLSANNTRYESGMENNTDHRNNTDESARKDAFAIGFVGTPDANTDGTVQAVKQTENDNQVVISNVLPTVYITNSMSEDPSKSNFKDDIHVSETVQDAKMKSVSESTLIQQVNSKVAIEKQSKHIIVNAKRRLGNSDISFGESSGVISESDPDEEDYDFRGRELKPPTKITKIRYFNVNTSDESTIESPGDDDLSDDDDANRRRNFKEPVSNTRGRYSTDEPTTASPVDDVDRRWAFGPPTKSSKRQSSKVNSKRKFLEYIVRSDESNIDSLRDGDPRDVHDGEHKDFERRGEFQEHKVLNLARYILQGFKINKMNNEYQSGKTPYLYLPLLIPLESIVEYLAKDLKILGEAKSRSESSNETESVEKSFNDFRIPDLKFENKTTEKSKERN